MLELASSKSETDLANKVLISIVVPIKNRLWCLPSLIQSIESQNFPKNKIEVIFVDNMSTDGSFKFLKEWSRKTKVFRRVVVDRIDGPLPRVRNRCIELSRGNYILFMDSDIVVPENAISGLFNHSKEDDIEIFHAPCLPTKMNLTYKILSLYDFKALQNGKTVHVLPSRTELGFTIFRRSFFDKVGLFEDDVRLDGRRGNWADMELMHRADRMRCRAIIDYALHVSHLKDFTPRSLIEVYSVEAHAKFLLNLLRARSLFHWARFLYYVGLPIVVILAILAGGWLGLSWTMSLFGVATYFSIAVVWNFRSKPDKITLSILRALTNMVGGTLLAYHTLFYVVKKIFLRVANLLRA